MHTKKKTHPQLHPLGKVDIKKNTRKSGNKRRSGVRILTVCGGQMGESCSNLCVVVRLVTCHIFKSLHNLKRHQQHPIIENSKTIFRSLRTTLTHTQTHTH